jgi:hypothetical protein
VAAARPEKLQAIEDDPDRITLANMAVNKAVDTIQKATGTSIAAWPSTMSWPKHPRRSH